MRVALIHHWNFSGDVSDRIWSALCRAWPHADRFTSDPCQSARISHWPAAAPRRLQLMEQSVPRHEQSLGRLPRDLVHDTALLSGYDLVLSTSRAAAELVTNDSALHGCFVTGEITDCVDEGQTSPAMSRFDTLQQLSQPPGSQVRLPKIWGREAAHVPAPHAGVTHFLASTHAVAAQHHFDFAGHPHVVLYPPIDTTFFRPGRDPRENFYLLVCHAGVPADVGLVIAACQAAHRNLVILGAEWLRESVSSTDGHVRWEAMPDDTTLRAYYRRCRAVLSVAPAGFEPALIEAQACGTPVIAYHGSATDELVLDAEQSGLGTGLMFHALTPSSIVSAIHEFERRPQNVSAVLSLAQAEKFSPAHFDHSLMTYLNRWLTSRAAQDAASISMTVPVEVPAASRRRAA